MANAKSTSSTPRSIRWKNPILQALEREAKKQDRSVNYLVNKLCASALGVK